VFKTNEGVAIQRHRFLIFALDGVLILVKV